MLTQVHAVRQRLILAGQLPVADGQLGMGLGQTVLGFFELGNVNGNSVFDHPAIGPTHGFFLNLGPALIAVVVVVVNGGLAVWQPLGREQFRDTAMQARGIVVVENLVTGTTLGLAKTLAVMPVDEDQLVRDHIDDIDAKRDDVEVRFEQRAFEHGAVLHHRYLAATVSRVSANFSCLTGFRI